MLYKFKSPAGADVIMNKEPAEQLLDVIGKSAGASGIITLEQIPAALQALRAEIARLEQLAKAAGKSAATDEEQEEAHASGRISFAQRAVPFMRLLELTQAEGKSVVWGV